MRLVIDVKQLTRLTGLTHVFLKSLPAFNCFFYCTYMLLEYGVAADVNFTKAEGNDLSWVFLTFLAMIFPIYAIHAA